MPKRRDMLHGKKLHAHLFTVERYAEYVLESKRCYDGDLTDRIASLHRIRGSVAVDIMTVPDAAAKTLLAVGRNPSEIVGGPILQLIQQPPSKFFEAYWSPETPSVRDKAMPQNPGKRLYDYCMERGEFVFGIRMGHVLKDDAVFRAVLTRYGVTLIPADAAALDRPVSIMNHEDPKSLLHTNYDFGGALIAGKLKLCDRYGNVDGAEADWAPFDKDNFHMPDYIFSPTPNGAFVGSDSMFSQWPKVPMPMLPMLTMSWFADAMSRLATVRSAPAPFGTDLFLWHIAREYLPLMHTPRGMKEEERVHWMKDMGMTEIWRTIDDDRAPPSLATEDSIRYLMEQSFAERPIVHHAPDIWDGMFEPFLHRDDAQMLRNACRARSSEYSDEGSDRYFWPFVGMRSMLHQMAFTQGIEKRAGLTNDEFINIWMMPPPTFKKLMSLPEAQDSERNVAEFYRRLPDVVPPAIRPAVPLPAELATSERSPDRLNLETLTNDQMLYGDRHLHLY